MHSSCKLQYSNEFSESWLVYMCPVVNALLSIFLFLFLLIGKEKNCIKKELCYMITTKKCCQNEKTTVNQTKKHLM